MYSKIKLLGVAMKKYKIKREKDSTLAVVKSVFKKIPIESYKTPCITIYSNGHLQIDNCKEILDYTENIIKINMGDFNVEIKGDLLKITSLAKGYITVTGEIFSLNYLYER